eukprot:jgi/Mesvir1/26747/Mv20523-RA.1
MADCGVVRAKALSVEGNDGALWRFRVSNHALRLERQIDEQWYLAYTYSGDMALPYMGNDGGVWEFKENVAINGDLIVRSFLRLPYTSRAEYDAALPSELVPKAYADLFPSWKGTEVLSGLLDVNAAGAQNGMGLVYDAGTSKWTSGVVNERGEYRSAAFRTDINNAGLETFHDTFVGSVAADTSVLPQLTFAPDTDLNITNVWVTVRNFPAPAHPAASSATVDVEVCDIAAEPVSYSDEITRVVTTGPLPMLTAATWDTSASTWTLVAQIQLPNETKIDLARDKPYRVRAKISTTGTAVDVVANVSIVLSGVKVDRSQDTNAPVSAVAPYAIASQTGFTVNHQYADAEQNNIAVVCQAYKGPRTGVTAASLMANSIGQEGFIGRKVDWTQGNDALCTGAFAFTNLEEGKPYDAYIAAKDSNSNLTDVSHARVYTLGGDMYGIPYESVKAFWDFEGNRPFDRVAGVEMKMSTFVDGAEISNFKDFYISESSIQYNPQTTNNEGFRASLHNKSFPLATDMTLVMDVFLPSTISHAGTNTQLSLFKYGAITSDIGCVSLALVGDGSVIHLNVNGVAAEVARTVAGLQLNAWNRVCLVRESDQWCWHVNGRKIDAADVNAGSDARAVGASTLAVSFVDDADFYMSTYSPSNGRYLTGVKHTNIAVLSMAAAEETVQRMRTPLIFSAHQAEKGCVMDGYIDLQSAYGVKQATGSRVVPIWQFFDHGGPSLLHE